MKIVCFVLVFGLMILTGCARFSGDSGVDNRWRSAATPEWAVGETSEQDVTDILGPPSQLINLGDETVFYYLLERQSGKAFILFIYNWGHQDKVYDRAVFFFDQNGKLAKYSYSHEALEYEEDK